MTKTLDFFFDLSSPWTYLAFHNIRPLLADMDVDIHWRPFLVGGIHNAVNKAYPEARTRDISQPKWKQLAQSLLDWAAYSDLPLTIPAQYFPLRSVNAMRFSCLLEDKQSDLERFIEAAFHGYFIDQRNLDDPDVLCDIANQIGLDGDALREGIKAQSCKDHLRANTDEAIARGAFGSPSVFVPFGRGERLYFGNDQLPLVKWALE